MAWIKRIALFFLINLLIVCTISFILNVFHVQPFLNHYGVSYRSLMIFCLIWGCTGAFLSLACSRWIAKFVLGVKLISSDTKDPEKQALLSAVAQLAQDARLPMPQVGIYQAKEVNAFATGPTRKRSLIAVSSGLLTLMEERELRGVLAHEMTHIANGDMVTMTLLQGIINAFVMFLARALALALSGFGSNRKESNRQGSYGSYILFTYLFEIVFMLAGSLLLAFYSRRREFEADRGGATLAGKDNMIAALNTLRVLQEIKDPCQKQGVFNAFKIHAVTKEHSLSRFFLSHPPLEERIERLQKV